MKTSLVPRAEQASGYLCLKVAEGPQDQKLLARIRDNLAFLQTYLPDMAPQIVEESADRLLFVAWEGTTFHSEQAAGVYESRPWIVDAVLAQLDRLQACEAKSRPLVLDQVRFLRPWARAWRHRIRLPLRAQRAFFSLVVRDLPWVLSHGNLSTWNIVVNESKQEVAMIDWEELAWRPKFCDEFSLAFHRCVPVDAMTWERSLLRKRLPLEDSAHQASSLLHTVALECLAYHYLQEVLRSRIGPDDEAKKHRVRIRYENLMCLVEPANWDKWLGRLLGN